MNVHLHQFSPLFFLSMLFLIAVGCEKEADVKIENVAEKVVIVSNFTPNEPIKLSISRSRSIFPTTSSLTLEKSEIQVCKGTNCELLVNPVISSVEDAVVRFTTKNILPKEEEVYSLSIRLNDGQVISATESTPAKVELDHVAVGSYSLYPQDPQTPNERKFEAKVSIGFNDKAGEENYYEVLFIQEAIEDNNIEPDTSLLAPVDYMALDPDVIDVRNITTNGILIDGKHFDGLRQELLFKPIFSYNPETQTPIKLRVQLRSISRSYFDYYTSVYRQVNQGSDPFIQPTEIVSNVNNALGIFAGYSKDQEIMDIEF